MKFPEDPTAGLEHTEGLLSWVFDGVAWQKVPVTEEQVQRAESAAQAAEESADAEGLGAEPILVTYPPRADNQAAIDAQNADVLTGYFGRYRYIDIAAALTLNNDRATWNPLYDTGDHVHENAAGNVAVFDQMQADVPDMFV